MRKDFWSDARSLIGALVTGAAILFVVKSLRSPDFRDAAGVTDFLGLPHGATPRPFPPPEFWSVAGALLLLAIGVIVALVLAFVALRIVLQIVKAAWE